jgi:hypothetical protein
MDRYNMVVGICFAAFALSACSPGGAPPAEVAETAESVLTPTLWSRESPASWPQLVLTNEAVFHGHSPLEGASAFLVRAMDGRTLAATARHLIGEAGGVEPAIPPQNLGSATQSWKLYPRTQPENFVEIDPTRIAEAVVGEFDWLILPIKRSANQLPSEPLVARKLRVKIGERIYLIGCPYSEDECKQNVYAGIVTERGYEDRFRYDLETPVDLHGFSGAPIIDQNGHVVGVTTIWFEPRMNNDLFLEGGGEDVASVYSLLK